MAEYDRVVEETEGGCLKKMDGWTSQIGKKEKYIDQVQTGG